MDLLIRVPEGEELLSYIGRFAAEKGIGSAYFTGIGGCSSATIGYYDFALGKYLEKEFHEQLEIVSLVGNIASVEGKPFPHAHVVLGNRDYKAFAGHLIEAQVHPFVELGITVLAEPVRKVFDTKKGLYILTP